MSHFEAPCKSTINQCLRILAIAMSWLQHHPRKNRNVEFVQQKIGHPESLSPKHNRQILFLNKNSEGPPQAAAHHKKWSILGKNLIFMVAKLDRTTGDETKPKNAPAL